MSEKCKKIDKVKVLRCQYPIVKGTDVKCEKMATKYDRGGWAYCKDHAPLKCEDIRYDK